MTALEMQAEALKQVDRIDAETRKAITTLVRWSKGEGGKAVIVTDGAPHSALDVQGYLAALEKHTVRLRQLARSKRTLRGRLRFATHVILDQPEARLCALLRAAVGCHLYQSPAELAANVAQLSAWVPLTETVRVMWVAKSKGGLRPLVAYGPMRRAQGLMLRDILSVAGIDSEFDYNKKGGGGERALFKKVSRLIEEGYNYWWTPDVKNFYGSLRPGHFRGLPLDRRLVKHVVFLPKCAKIRVCVKEADQENILQVLKAQHADLMVDHTPIGLEEFTSLLVRRGLPQGSVLSPLMARSFVGNILRSSLSAETEGASFCDDLAIAAPNNNEMKTARQAVANAFSSQTAGPIGLHHAKVQKVHSGRVTFLGYHIEPGRGHEPGTVHVKPGRPRIKRFRRRLVTRLESALPGQDLLEVAEEYRKRWYAGQQAWTKVPGFSDRVSNEITFHYVMDFEMGLPIGDAFMGAAPLKKN